MVKHISLILDRKETETLARVFSLMIVQLKTNPKTYDASRMEILESTFQKLDRAIHEDAHWCDREDCSYWVKKRAQKEARKHATQIQKTS